MYIGSHDEHNHCLEDCLLSYFLLKGIPYCYMYADSWRFYCEEDNLEQFGGVEGQGEYPHEDVLNKMIGVHREDLDTPSIIELESCLREDKFVGCHYDAFYCNWSIAYQEYHMEHYLLLSQMDGERMILSDPYLKKKVVNYNFSHFRKNQGSFFLLSGGKCKIEIKELLSYVSNVNEGMFDTIRRFGRNIENIDVGEYGKEYTKEITASPLYQNITYIVNSRYNLSKLFYYEGKIGKVTYFLGISDEFWNIAKTWEGIKAELIKMIISPSYYKKKRVSLKERIYELAYKEEMLLVKVKQTSDLGGMNGKKVYRYGS